MKEKDYFVAYVDGCCEPSNPGGHMGIGAFILNPKRERIFTHSEHIPADKNNSNNVAEYKALISVLKFFLENGMQNEKIIICGDSKLSIMQMKGGWKMNGGLYEPYYREAKEMVKNFTKIQCEWIPREKNEIADQLSKAPMKKAGVQFRIQKG